MGGDDFVVRARAEEPEEAPSDVRWLWIERIPQRPCGIAQLWERELRLPSELQDEESPSGSSILALPPGQEYTAFKLQPCFAAALQACSRSNSSWLATIDPFTKTIRNRC